MSAQRHRSNFGLGAPARALAAGAILGASLCPSPAAAQDLAYCDLAIVQQASKLQQNGDATVVSSGERKKQGIRLTDEKTNQRSTVFHKIPLQLKPGTPLYQHFRVRVSGGALNIPPNGADGMSFMLQNYPGGDPLGVGAIGTAEKAIGIPGAGFGYGGIIQSLAFELDTLKNDGEMDPDGNHIALISGGLTGHTDNGTAMGKMWMPQPVGSTVEPWQPVQLDVTTSIESNATSYDTRDVWIDYECSGPDMCTMKVFMTFNNALLGNQFADSTKPATLPLKPEMPVMVVQNVKDISTYLGGTAAFAGFSASTGAAMDEHLVTFWILSKKPLVDADMNNLEDACECNTAAAACEGNLPICDSAAGAGFCRDCLNDPECAAKDPLNPICDLIVNGGEGACVECTSDMHCPSEEPFCNTFVNVCTANCSGDDMCDAAEWCDNPSGVMFGGTCLSDLANGEPIPASDNHNPPLDGTCTEEAAMVVCQSGVCDTSDDACGYPVGGPCTDQNGSVVCRSGICSPAGTCACADDVDCGDASSGKVCDAMSGECRDGCRGMGGNGCPMSFVCSSTTNDIGTCKKPGPVVTPAGGLATVEGAGLFRCGAAGSGGSSEPVALVMLAALAAHVARRRRR
jgi:hypothetical protein